MAAAYLKHEGFSSKSLRRPAEGRRYAANGRAASEVKAFVL